MNEVNPQNNIETQTEQVKNEQQNNQIPIEQPVQEPVEDKNWAAIREQRKADRKAREEAEKRAREKAEEAAALKAALEAIANKPSPIFNTGYQEQEETEDQRLERLLEIKLKQREEQLQKERHAIEMREYPKRLRQSYPDFEKVVNAENLDYIEYHYPKKIAPYQYMPDGFEKWECIYEAVKEYIPNLDSKKEVAKIDKNLAKPGSISSIGTTQPTSAGSSHILTEQRKQENWARMQRELKGIK